MTATATATIDIFDGDAPAYSLTCEQLLETHTVDCRDRAVIMAAGHATAAACLLAAGRLDCLCEGTPAG